MNFDTDVVEVRQVTKLGLILIDSDMWWHDLYEVARPLNDRHMDVAFYYMRMLLKLKNGGIRATTTDCNFDFKIRGISKELAIDTRALHKHESLFTYAKGRKIPFNVPWNEVDHVLIPMWIPSPSHWILGHFDLVNWRLDVYNSYNRIIKNHHVYSSIRSMRIALPIIAKSVNCGVRIFPDAPLECRLIGQCPQQRNGGDCGIYVIKYAEYIIEGKIGEMPSMFDTSTARSNLAIQMYKYMLEKPDIIWLNDSRSLNLKK